MSYPITDILAYTKKLKAAGENDAVAEAHAEMLGKLVENTLATKEDIKGLATKEDMVATKAEVATLEHKIDKVDSKLNWMIALIGLFGAIISSSNGLMAILHHIQWL